MFHVEHFCFLSKRAVRVTGENPCLKGVSLYTCFYNTIIVEVKGFKL